MAVGLVSARFACFGAHCQGPQGVIRIINQLIMLQNRLYVYVYMYVQCAYGCRILYVAYAVNICGVVMFIHILSICNNMPMSNLGRVGRGGICRCLLY